MELPGQVARMTGATGFVGRRTAQRLMLAGMRVRGLVRRLVELPGLERSLGDSTDAATVAPAAVGAHVVVHGAAVLHRATRAEAMRVNVEDTRIVLEAARHAGCERLIHLSTMSGDENENSTGIVRTGYGAFTHTPTVCLAHYSSSVLSYQ
jgi:nucleoside-diphosphate-sugar epimerase